jgi:hypothetical protein
MAPAAEWTPALVLKHVEDLFTQHERALVTRFEGVAAQFAGTEKAVAAALASAEKAVAAALAAADRYNEKSERTADKWREAANEWRTAMDDREDKFYPRAEAETALKAVSDRLAVVESWTQERAGQSRGVKDSWGMLIGAVGLAGAVVALIAR